MYIFQRKKLISLVSGTHSDMLCHVANTLAQRNIPIPDWQNIKSLPSFWQNVAILVIPTQTGDVYVPVPADRLILAYFWTVESYGLTMLYKKHGVVTLADVCSNTRDELFQKAEVGRVTITEIDRILRQLHLKYKDDAQMDLYPGDFPATLVS